MPSTPAEMPAGSRLPGNGVLYVGSKGKMYHGAHGGMPQLLPAELMEEAATVPQTMPTVTGPSQGSGCWPAPDRAQLFPNFGYSGPLTETVLLGVLAQRAPWP